jgi:ribosomal protein S5
MENTAVTENLGSEVLEEKLVQVNRVAKVVKVDESLDSLL